MEVRGLYVSHPVVRQFPWSNVVFALLITSVQAIEDQHPRSTINKLNLLGLYILCNYYCMLKLEILVILQMFPEGWLFCYFSLSEVINPFIDSLA